MIAGFSNQLFLQNKLMKQPRFFYVDTHSQKLKFTFFFWLGIVKNGCGQSALGTLKLNVSEE